MTRVAVIGAGIAGLSTAYALRERGADVTIYERGEPGCGQSGGESRIFRHAHGDPRLVALACEAGQGWWEWEQRLGRELLSRDGVVAVGPAAKPRLAMLQEAGVKAHPVDAHPLQESRDGFAMLDEDGGVIRVRATFEVLVHALGQGAIHDEVFHVRPGPTVEVRAGGSTAEYERVVLTAGRGTPALARAAGLEVPIRESAHVRLTFPVREPPPRLPCLLDGDRGAYGNPLPGNAAFAVGMGLGPVDELERHAAQITAYVERELPGLEPIPVGARRCWVTKLPWSHDGIAVYELENLIALAGNNLFKHAPAIGRALADTALGDPLPEFLRPGAKLGVA